VREVFKQPEFSPIPVAEQIAVLLAVTSGLFDDLPLEEVAEAEMALRRAVIENLSDLARRIEAGEALSDEDQEQLLGTMREALQ
jgi:F-type H+/Na+-transporting ATPase subunit alpha